MMKKWAIKAADLYTGCFSAYELTKKAQEARRQIDEKGYEADFQARGIEKILKYGIAFCGKQVILV